MKFFFFFRFCFSRSVFLKRNKRNASSKLCVQYNFAKILLEHPLVDIRGVQKKRKFKTKKGRKKNQKRKQKKNDKETEKGKGKNKRKRILTS